MLDFRLKGPGLDPRLGHGDFLRVRDKCIRTLINHSQDLSMSRFRSIVHKTWAYQDSNKSPQVIGISVLRLITTRSIIRKTWTYQDCDQSFTRLWHIKTLINRSQDLDISSLSSIICKTWALLSIHMPIMSWICQSCQ